MSKRPTPEGTSEAGVRPAPTLALLPDELWIELTSKCPLACVFCSRELLRGRGEHMDFERYRELIEALEAPRIIQLNYSGESTHHPRIVEAVERASASGAHVELVSALTSLKVERVAALAGSGLDRLTVSIHTLDDPQYRNIYGFGSAEALLERLDRFADAAAGLASEEKPTLDFAFVAMQRNLDQLEPIGELAERFGVASLDVHPVIRRDPIPETFDEELDGTGRLRRAFLDQVDDAVRAVRIRHPGLDIRYSTPEVDTRAPALDETPQPYPYALPPGARIHDCDQSPFRTVHVLANGDVVACEVRDQIVMGNLGARSLGEIWLGEAYQRFREAFRNGQDPHCAACPYKRAYLPGKAEEVPAVPRKRWPGLRDLVARGVMLGLDGALGAATLAGRLLGTAATGRAELFEAPDDSLAVVIPERDSPELLASCLTALADACAQLTVDVSVLVVVNGAPLERYDGLRAEHPSIRWLHHGEPLGFGAAIERALAAVEADWVFLLNSDMRLEPEALARIWAERSPERFSLACQLFFEDSSRRREETGRTALLPALGLGGLHDIEPGGIEAVRPHLYSGGGASLFQARWLRSFLEVSQSYAPFYWEDVDWGLRAQAAGFQNVFVPGARAHHRHRGTIGRFYDQAEIDRIVQRNAFQHGLAWGWLDLPLRERAPLLARHRRDLLRPGWLSWLLKTRALAARAARRITLDHRGDTLLFHPPAAADAAARAHLPWLLLASPFLLYPRHGSALRILALCRELRAYYRIALLADEGWAFEVGHASRYADFDAVHLLRQVRSEARQDRLSRIVAHARPALRAELERMRRRYRPALIQIEHEELCALAPRWDRIPWFLTLHDVNRTDRRTDRTVDRYLRRYRRVIACSPEDAAALPGSALVANGTDVGERLPASKGATMVFAGSFAYRANRTAVLEFVQACLPAVVARVPDARLVVLGGNEAIAERGRGPFAHPAIELHGYTDDVRSALADAALTINPMTSIRGSCLKTLESLAAGRICVSTRDAARGFLTPRPPGLIVVGEVSDMVLPIVELLRNPPRRHRLEAEAHAAAERWGWRHRAAEQLSLYREARV